MTVRSPSDSSPTPSGPAPSGPTPGPTSGLDRRTVLRAGALAGAAVGTGVFAGPAANAAAATPPGVGAPPEGAAAVFQHGVASGDPMPDRVILWTRVTPAPEAVPGSGLGELVVVDWEVSPDPTFATLTRSGSVTTDAGRDHTVKFDATGLAPDSWYHYRSRALGQTSPVGRTRTAPADGAMPATGRWRTGVVSCSNWEAGYFAGYRHLEARGDLDVIIELGDYIYEYGRGEYTGKQGAIRDHNPPHEILTLADYRTRLGQYRTESPDRFDGRAIDQTGTMTGAEQFDWLARGLASSTARWNVIGNSVMVSPVLIPPLDHRTMGAITELLGVPREGITYNADQWDGYAGERRRLFEVIRSTGNRNHVFLTGDIHSSWVNEVPYDPADYPGAGTGAVEFVTPSITSNNIDDMVKLPEGNGLSAAAQGALSSVNRHVRWVDLDRHGFSVLEFTTGYAHADYWAVVAREDPNSGAYPMASWRTPHGTDRLEPAGLLP